MKKTSLRHTDAEATHCMLGNELCKESLCGPALIILALEEQVVLYATHMDNLPDGVEALTPYDQYGVRLISVPLRFVDEFITSEEARLIEDEKELFEKVEGEMLALQESE
jgi:hypothetical protein